MDFMVARVLRSGFLDGQDWVVYLEVGGAMNELVRPSWVADQAPRPVWLTVWGPESGRLCTEFPGQIGTLVLLWRLGKSGLCWV